VPPENIVYADRAGNIGEHSTGLVPVRTNFNGLLPVPGTGEYEWSGFVPNAQLPHSYNPAAGFIATANQKTIADSYAYAVGFEWSPPTRFERIQEVLEGARHAGHRLTVPDMEALQLDVVSLLARRMQLLLRQALGAEGGTTAKAAELILDWNGELRTDSPSAALYEVWTTRLCTELTQRAVPDRMQGVLPTWSLYQVVLELSQPRAALFGANTHATRDALLRDTLLAAYQELATKEGTDPRRWQWGQLHKAYFRHALDSAPGAASLLDRGPAERPGDGDVVQATDFEDGSFEQTSGASYREILDLADWDHSVAINVPGQSGQPGSKHFDDLLPLWSSGQYFPLRYSRAAVDADTSDVLILQP
jgi:penicillin G amidase